MPSKYVVRNFSIGEVYHIYNRGVEKRQLFFDNEDYQTFCNYLAIYLLPQQQVRDYYPKLPLRLQTKNLHDAVTMYSYCIMPNHFHLLLKENSPGAISKLLQQLTAAYAYYFNRKYKRVGSLVQGRFQCVPVRTTEQLLHVSRYIHLNPLIADLVNVLSTWRWSSYPAYSNSAKKTFCDTRAVLGCFPSPAAYQQFCLNQVDYAQKLNTIKHLLLE